MRLAPLTRYGIGGPAPRLARPASRESVRDTLRDLGDDPYRVLGAGANVLVADRGVRLAILILGGELDYVKTQTDRIEAGAAARLPSLVGTARRSAREGFSFLEAVPGTVGGGLRMNAGGRDVWIWHRVIWADVLTSDRQELRLTPSEVGAGYRSVDVPAGWVFLGAAFEAPPGDADAIEETHRVFRDAKVRNQVYELPSVGSTWKNPAAPFGSAWEVVDRVGMRGATRGGAEISDRHANFIVNHGDATADDVLGLMIETRRRAHEELGIWLEPEICLWGFDREELQQVGAVA